MKLTFNDSSNLYFTSDQHWCHANVIKFCNRPYQDVEEMNQVLIDNCNSVVKADDTILMLGDFCFGPLNKWVEIRNKINCKNIILVKGNHDKLQDGQIKHLFSGIYDYLEIKVRDVDAKDGWQQIVCCHYALKVWNKSHYGSWNAFAHSHGTLPDDPNALSCDVGVDCWNYFPVSYEQLKGFMGKKTFKPLDHHRGDSTQSDE